MTTSERWDRVARVFFGALDRPEPEREEWLETACRGQEALLEEVVALLDAHGASGPLDALATDVPRLLRAALPGEPAPGARVGAFRLLERLGRGGMGVVYLAARADADFEQRVALKLLRGGIGGVDLVGRFLRERRILARLDHPNITRLLDGGITAEDVPYFAMEYVDGRPIHRYCDDRRLSLAHRIRLFATVCEAMQYAHGHLIVHRDVKPSNILVTGDGTVKILDFGIAKLLDDEEAGSGSTRTGQRWMTPEYASPEQVRGEPVTTASDVYSLGVVLYELLSGHHPYGDAVGNRHRMERAILESDPSRPSEAVSRSDAGDTEPGEIARARGAPPLRLRKQLSGDLDTIVLKAIRKEPGERYAMAGELAQDLRRHLEGLPVRARRHTLRYRASRFVRRHRLAVAAVALIGLAILGGAAATAWQARRATLQAQVATRERDRARTEANKAQQISEFVVGLFEAADPAETRGVALPVGELLDRGRERVDEDLADQPEVQAAMLAAIGKAYQNLGAYERAAPPLERALELRREALGPGHPDVATALHDLGVLRHLDGDLDEAEEDYRAAVSLRRRQLAGGEGDLDDLRSDLSVPLRSLAALLVEKEELEEAELLYREALQLAEEVYGDEDVVTAMTLMGLGGALKDDGRLDEADSALTRALALTRRHHEGANHPQLYKAVNNLAVLRLEQGRLAEAEPLLRESLEMRRRLYGEEHPDVASGLQNLGAVLKELGRTSEAASLYREALDMRRRLLGDGHPDVIYTLSSLALLHHDAGECDQAIPLFQEALPGWRATFGPRHGLTLKAQGLLGHCLAQVARYGEAEGHLLEAHAALDSLVGPEHGETRRVASFLAELYGALGKDAAAARYRALADSTVRR